MRVKFTKRSPRVGTKNNPKSSDWERSPYYWWYECLRRNPQYQRCIAVGGSSSLQELFSDFGDVNVPFREWWTFRTESGGLNRGAKLFAEPPERLGLVSLDRACELGEEGHLFVSIPKHFAKRDIKREINRILKYKFTRKRAEHLKSKAKYPIVGNPNCRAIKMSLKVWDCYKENPSFKLWELAALCIPSYRDVCADSHGDRKRIAATTASRYKRKAQRMIDNVAIGKFL